MCSSGRRRWTWSASASASPTPDRFEETSRKVQRALFPVPGWTADQLRAITTPALLVFGDRDVVPQHASRCPS
ncbi:hypothetical protein SAMN05443637_105101 [Pseudonocardia thermophila]|uniref:Alpha/beta hydrolase family protein n=1 Tax=Pseudonocardia thermophila TaxID=1848 RepID=A0A1M6RQ52_PSETH|nr:hypothetical protein SAMN05443637_105101 [Pseudonocardia thermophila]